MMNSRIKRSSKIDPLELLREYTMSKKEIVKREQYLQFESTKLDLKAPTAWKKNTGGYYSLGDLWLFLQKVEQSMAPKIYFGQRQALSLEGIEKIDEDEIVNYFQGKIDNCDKIDQDTKQLLLNSKKSKPSDSAAQEPAMVKKRKLSDEGEVVKSAEMQQRDQHLNAIQWILKTEKPITSKTRILRSKYNTNINFKQFLKYLDDGKSGPGQQSSSQTASSSSEASSQSTINYPCLFKDLRDKRLRPIIVVPTMGRAGNISLFNSKKFFDEGQYEDPERKDINSGERVITFERTIKGHPFVFEVYDSVGTFEPKMNTTQKSKWDRVVGVFVTGQKYQFKEWPKYENIPNILDSVRGFFLKYHETPTPEQVSNWNIKVINVYRQRRHQDKPAQEGFWTELENFMIQPKNKHRQ